MNSRTIITSPVTRLIRLPDSLAPKKRKLNRCSLSYTLPRRSTTRFCTSVAIAIWLPRSSTKRSPPISRISPATRATRVSALQASGGAMPSGHCGGFRSRPRSGRCSDRPWPITSIASPSRPRPPTAMASKKACISRIAHRGPPPLPGQPQQADGSTGRCSIPVPPKCSPASSGGGGGRHGKTSRQRRKANHRTSRVAMAWDRRRLPLLRVQPVRGQSSIAFRAPRSLPPPEPAMHLAVYCASAAASEPAFGTPSPTPPAPPSPGPATPWSTAAAAPASWAGSPAPCTPRAERSSASSPKA